MKNTGGQKAPRTQAGERIEKVSGEKINRRGKWMTMQKRDERQGGMSRQKAWWTKGKRSQRRRQMDGAVAGANSKSDDKEKWNGGHLWVSLLIRYLEEVDGFSEGGFLKSHGEDQGELLRQAERKHMAAKQKFREVRGSFTSQQ